MSFKNLLLKPTKPKKNNWKVFFFTVKPPKRIENNVNTHRSLVKFVDSLNTIGIVYNIFIVN